MRQERIRDVTFEYTRNLKFKLKVFQNSIIVAVLFNRLIYNNINIIA